MCSWGWLVCRSSAPLRRAAGAAPQTHMLAMCRGVTFQPAANHVWYWLLDQCQAPKGGNGGCTALGRRNRGWGASALPVPGGGGCPP